MPIWALDYFSRYSMKVVKAAAQVLNTLWQYRDLRTIYKKVMTLSLVLSGVQFNVCEKYTVS